MKGDTGPKPRRKRGAAEAPRAAPDDVAEVAAVDLGSNSFHMMVARSSSGQLQVLDRLREAVRLAGGLDARNRLTEHAQERALECLKRFGQRLHGIPAQRVRVVGTNTLRKLQDGAHFIGRRRAPRWDTRSR